MNNIRKAACAALLALPAMVAFAQSTSTTALSLPAESDSVPVEYVSPLRDYHAISNTGGDPSRTWRQVNDAVASADSMESMKSMDMPTDVKNKATDEQSSPHSTMGVSPKSGRSHAGMSHMGPMKGMTMPEAKPGSAPDTEKPHDHK